MPEYGDADVVIKTRFETEGKKTVEEIYNILKNIQQQAKIISTESTATAKAQVAASQQAKAAYDNEMKSRKEWADLLKQDQTQKRQQTKEQLSNLQQQANAFKQTGKETKNTTNILSSLGTVGKYVFGTVLGLSAVQALRNVVHWLQQAAQYGYEFAKAVFQLQIGVNALNRSGVDITIQDIYTNLDKLQEKFGVFSRKELVEGSAALVNLIRDFGLTREQISLLQDSVATLAVVNGRAMDEVQRTVALALSSGYTEGLQRLGVSINRVTIAIEAQRLGYGRNYMSLTEVQRAEATYNLILRKTAKYQNDLEAYQKTSPGRIDKAKVAWTDLATTLGEQVIPVVATLADAWGWVAKSTDDAIKKADEYEQKYGTKSTGGKGGVGKTSTAAVWKYRTSGMETDDEKNIKKQMQERIALIAKNDETLTGYALELGDDLDEIEENYEDTLKDNWEDYLDDKQDLTMDYIQKGLDIEEEFGERLKEIQDSYTDDTKKAWEDYYQSIADENLDYNQNVADANDELHKDLIEAEEDYQDKMHELRQKFLFDLEDAVRERDAKQAMLLIRQYNFDKTQIKEDKDEDIEDIKQNHKEELAELKKQHQRKLAELKRQLNRQLAEIQTEYETELAELNIWKAEEYKAREEWYAKELALAEANWTIQNEKAKKARSDALIDLVKDYNKQYNLTARQWARLLELAGAYIGADGGLTRLQQAYWDWVAANAAAVNSAAVTNPSSLSPIQQANWGGSYANGGEITVNKPTLAMFGERGTETATFTKGGKSNGNGKLAIELLLSPDLEARIIDNAMGEFADVMVSVEKVR